MKKKITVTVGIPAYNEEANITRLLKMVLSQKGNFMLERVIVICDGCSDNTCKVARKTLRGSAGKVFEGRKRLGKTAGLNKIFKVAKSDILVLLDADVIIKDNRFIEKLIAPIAEDKADLVSSKLVPFKPITFIEKVIYVSVLIKDEIAQTYNGGDNLYTCRGANRAFSKRYYSTFRLPPDIVSEDAYSYLWSKKKGFSYKYVKEAKVFYRLPGNISDHKKQSVRFLKGQKGLKRYFTPSFVEKMHRLPVTLILPKTCKYLFRHPKEVLAYIPILVLMKIKVMLSPQESLVWQVAKSTRFINL